MITCAYYIDYPVPALLYDAEAGNSHSRLAVFYYFATLAERGQPIPDDLAKFVGKHLRQVIDGDQTPAKMFNPESKKHRAYDPYPADLVAFSDVGGDIHAKFEAIAERTGEREGTIKKRFYDHRAYSKRLLKIQALLDERQQAPSFDRHLEISRELTALTSKP